jgi:hypothetical protein
MHDMPDSPGRHPVELPDMPSPPDPLEQQTMAAQLRKSLSQGMHIFWWLVGVQGVLIVTLLAVVGYLLSSNAATSAQITANTSTLRTQSITNCENNNKFREAQVQTWEKNYALQAQESKATGTLLTQLIATLANGDPNRIRQINAILAQSDKAGASEITTFLNYVREVDAPKNCQALYQVPGS